MSELIIRVIAEVEKFEALFNEEIEINRKIKEKSKVEEERLLLCGLVPETAKEVVSNCEEIKELETHRNSIKRKKREIDIKLSVIFKDYNPLSNDGKIEEQILLNEINKTLEFNKIDIKKNFLSPYLVKQLRDYKKHFESQIEAEKEKFSQKSNYLNKKILYRNCLLLFSSIGNLWLGYGQPANYSVEPCLANFAHTKLINSHHLPISFNQTHS